MSLGTAVIAVEGVLRKLEGDSPIVAGVTLYAALTASFNVVLLSLDPETDRTREHLDRFLAMNGMNKHQHIVYTNETMLKIHGGVDERIRQVSTLRMSGFVVDLVVEAHPGKAAALFNAGYTVLNFMHPQYSRPEWRPDAPEQGQDWAVLRERVEREAFIRAQDDRTRF